MKYNEHLEKSIDESSHLTRGAWIEIEIGGGRPEVLFGRTSHEVRGLKSVCLSAILRDRSSHLTRGAWIEISFLGSVRCNIFVAPHTRCVD